jgi:UDP-glucuronate 4-epimerase
MKILVTGAAGFIGFHLTRRLLERGDSVVGIDNMNDYYDVNLKTSRLNELGFHTAELNQGKPLTSRDNNKCSFVKMDLKDRDRLAGLFKEEGFDCICNLAAQAGVRFSLENPYAYVESNINGFLNILETCRRYPVRHLVYASSSSVYGDSDKFPLCTSDSTDYPVSLYAATKKSNELMAHSYSHLFSIPCTGLRFFTVYGPWGRPDMAYFLFTRAILSSKPISIFNNGEMYRDFTYIDDIVEGIIRVIDHPPVKGSLNRASTAPHRIYNIGNSAPVKLTDFIDAIEEALGIKAIRNYLPLQQGDVHKTFADVSDLIRDFGYAPKTGIKEGVREFINWYKSYYK